MQKRATSPRGKSLRSQRSLSRLIDLLIAVIAWQDEIAAIFRYKAMFRIIYIYGETAKIAPLEQARIGMFPIVPRRRANEFGHGRGKYATK